ncbi:HAD-IA family hydrolase [Rhizobium aegyptiacum]|uniref:HAD-IA family hydrolase n=1 Tax=Rhizobium aegyptiacum TaxID=1764550 RepID=UPI0007E5601A|nr:HAD-IA family hydrolase [Rhizobium aegyptiacum]
MALIKALIFDVDGTLAETEEVHREAFNLAFAQVGLGWNWDRLLYGMLLRIAGGRERIEIHAAQTGTRGIDSLDLHRRKTRFYNDLLANKPINLRPGVEALIGKARSQGIHLAIATTTSRINVQTLLKGTLGSHSESWFRVICCAEDVDHKKPNPQVYFLTLARLGLSASCCVAFEDSENGLVSAKAAGLTTVITPSIYTMLDSFEGADLCLSALGGTLLFPPNPAPENPGGVTTELAKLLSLQLKSS